MAELPTHEVSCLSLREDWPPTPRRVWELQLSRLTCLQQNLVSFYKAAPEIKGEQCSGDYECSLESRELPVSRGSLVRQVKLQNVVNPSSSGTWS